MMLLPPRPGSRLVLLAAALLAGCAAGGSAGGTFGEASVAGPDAPSTWVESAVPPRRRPAVASAAAVEPQGSFGPYLAGRFAAGESDTRVAADQLLDALGRDPDQAEVLRRAFTAAVMDGRAEAARLARRLPDDQLAVLLLAGADAQAGRWERAEAKLRALPRQGAGQVLQPVLVAWAQAGRGATDAALATLKPWTEDGRLRGVAGLHAAMIADLANRPRDSERLLRAALAETPEPSLRTATIAAGILARAGQAADGAALFDRMTGGADDAALAAGPSVRAAALGGRAVASATEGMAEAEVALGAALRAQGLPELSLVLARLALRLRPGFGPAVLLSAEALADERHWDGAAAALDAVSPADGLAPLVALRRAVLLDGAGRTDEALATLRALGAAQPLAPQPAARRGDILRARNRFADAAEAYAEAIARMPAGASSAWSLHYARGIALERSGRWADAEPAFQRALALSPDQPYVLNYLGYTWADRGENLAEARRMLESASAQRPNDGNIADSLGWAMFRQGDLPGALRTLERAAELESRSATVNDHLGDVYWASGRRTEARFQWGRALDLDPEPAEAERIRAKLRDGLRTGAATAR